MTLERLLTLTVLVTVVGGLLLSAQAPRQAATGNEAWSARVMPAGQYGYDHRIQLYISTDPPDVPVSCYVESVVGGATVVGAGRNFVFDGTSSRRDHAEFRCVAGHPYVGNKPAGIWSY